MSKITIFIFVTLISSCSPQINVDIVNYDARDKLVSLVGNKVRKKGLGETLAIFPIHYNKKTPKIAQNALNKHLHSLIKQYEIYDNICSREIILQKFSKNGELQKKAEIFFDTFVNVSVIDRDLSSSLSQFLGVEDFAIFQVDFWPCKNCLINDTLRMKFRIFNAKTGDLLWYGAHEKYNLLKNDQKNTLVAYQTMKEITDSFFHRYKEKWHKKRFNSLKKLGHW